ncbi:MAG: sel1 repeat family protein [Lachnospiraceae bacterium]|nr:sel1 repeat family protein [Lachnospiraceae bacterium]
MFKNHTVLRKLQKILSEKEHRLFDNQVSFYNGIFGMTNPEIFQDALVAYMENAESASPGDRKKQDIESFFRGGLDNSSSNIGKHINDDLGMAIPKFHCVHYAQPENKMEICKRLAAVIRYCSLRHEIDHTHSNSSWSSLFLRLKDELSYASKILSQAEEADILLMGSILYEIIQTHLSERHSAEASKWNIPGFGKVNMNQQLEEYYLTCDCYEATSIDFFLALQRMAEKNVIASSNLAGFFYVGMEFLVKNEGLGPHGKYIVERNLEQAAYYFKRAASSQPPYAPALYSYGYMLLHEETGAMPYDLRLTEVEQYYQRAAEQKFHHAVSGLGDLALLRAEKLLQQVDATEHSEVIEKELSSAIEYYVQAESMGSFWGSIKAAQFLDNPSYAPYRKAALEMAGQSVNLTAREKWKNAVVMGNVFAMDELAMLDLRLGYIQEALELLEQAVKMNYPNASYHLAQEFYHKNGFSPDPKKYRRFLEKASLEGSARASLALGKLALQNSSSAKTANQNESASIWFQKAEEQNLLCFEKEVYDELHFYHGNLS